MTEPVPVVVLGGSGYVAGEAVRLLAAHPGFELAAVTARQKEAFEATGVPLPVPSA